MGISDFWISGQSLIKVNCHNSRTSDDINWKLGPVTKLGKTNNVKKIDNDIMPTNCDAIVIFLIYGKFGGIRKPDSRRVVCKTSFSVTVTFYLTKTENRTKKSLTQLSHYYFE